MTIILWQSIKWHCQAFTSSNRHKPWYWTKRFLWWPYTACKNRANLTSRHINPSEARGINWPISFSSSGIPAFNVTYKGHETSEEATEGFKLSRHIYVAYLLTMKIIFFHLIYRYYFRRKWQFFSGCRTPLTRWLTCCFSSLAYVQRILLYQKNNFC